MAQPPHLPVTSSTRRRKDAVMSETLQLNCDNASAEKQSLPILITSFALQLLMEQTYSKKAASIAPTHSESRSQVLVCARTHISERLW